MRFVYLSRVGNRAGYFALKYLLEDSPYAPSCVLLPQARVQPADPIPANAYNHHRFTGSIADLARDHGTPVVHANDINSPDVAKLLRSHDPELVVIGGGWPQLLGEHVISSVPFGAINAHPSLLPEFRGTDIHRWQVLHGVGTSGATVHYLESTFDTGRIISQEEFRVAPDDTPQALAGRAAGLTGRLIVDALEKIMAAPPGVRVGRPQGEPVGIGYFSRWPWKDLDFLRIQWLKPASELARLVLACTQESYYYNGPYAYFQGEPFIIRQAESRSHPRSGHVSPGSILEHSGQGPLIQCGSGALLLTEVQPASRSFWPDGFHTSPALGGPGFGKLLQSARIQVLV